MPERLRPIIVPVLTSDVFSGYTLKELKILETAESLLASYFLRGNTAFLTLVADEDVAKLLNSPDDRFEGRTPLQLIREQVIGYRIRVPDFKGEGLTDQQLEMVQKASHLINSSNERDELDALIDSPEGSFLQDSFAFLGFKSPLVRILELKNQDLLGKRVFPPVLVWKTNQTMEVNDGSSVQAAPKNVRRKEPPRQTEILDKTAGDNWEDQVYGHPDIIDPRPKPQTVFIHVSRQERINFLPADTRNVRLTSLNMTSLPAAKALLERCQSLTAVQAAPYPFSKISQATRDFYEQHGVELKAGY